MEQCTLTGRRSVAEDLDPRVKFPSPYKIGCGNRKSIRGIRPSQGCARASPQEDKEGKGYLI